MNFEYFCKVYSLGTLHSVSEEEGGTSAKVWRLDTEKGVFLLRTLPDHGQGELEFALSGHLLSRGFTRCPAVLSAGGAPCIQAEGVWYQVQTFLSGTMPDPAQPGVAKAMADTLRALAEALRDFPHGPMIHGDLGPWNMLLDSSGTVSVVDFGSARTGDPYFDFAAALGGVINHSEAEARAQVCREFVTALEADRTRLLAQLRLWAEEGAARWGHVSDAMTARFYHALNWAEENLYEL